MLPQNNPDRPVRSPSWAKAMKQSRSLIPGALHCPPEEASDEGPGEGDRPQRGVAQYLAGTRPPQALRRGSRRQVGAFGSTLKSTP